MIQPYRLASGGRIDRSRVLPFQFGDGEYEGHPGDTLASALLANGVRLVARSFKYHRPRGIFAAGPEEPSALVQLETGAFAEPNRRAPDIPLYNGLRASRQHAWPSLNFDLGALADRAAPFFPAGFYYKTFIKPALAWRWLWEPALRHMAGLGRTPQERDPSRYDHAHAHCDVLVIGAGPAGLAAALAAGHGGARVILADGDVEFGGTLLRRYERIGDQDGAAWAGNATAELALMPEVRLLPNTMVLGRYDGNYAIAAERVGDLIGPAAPPELPRHRLWHIRAHRIVVATGAIERPLVFTDNDRPGIMLAGAAETYLNRYGVAPGRRVVVFTNNDDAYGVAAALADAGVAVAAIVDLRAEPGGTARVSVEGIPLYPAHAVFATAGQRSLSRVWVRPVAGGARRAIDCDLLAVSGGWNPALHLFAQAPGRLRYDHRLAAFVPEGAGDGIQCAGAANGAFSLAGCLVEGAAAGASSATSCGFGNGNWQPPVVEPQEPEAPIAPIWLVPGAARRAFVDLHNDVTAADIALAAREGFVSVEHVKRWTTLGMGTDQGKTGNVTGLALLAATLGRTPGETGTTTFRPPYVPVPFGLVAGPSRGPRYAPVRLTPMHDWHAAAGAVFEDVAQWQRPRYYPRSGEDMEAAVRRECLAARDAAALLDASTLGKVEVAGPDAARFLDRVYVNRWHDLPVGRCRYGVMCRDDGMVFDDGVGTRLAEDRFFLTTTTGNAAAVLDWLEEWFQTEWTDLDVFCSSLTDEWANATLVGPKAREILATLVPGLAPDRAAFPFMTMREADVGHIPARIFRVSFSGELSYEINVPAECGLPLWEALIEAGADHGITPYGTEAMHVMRAEKGFFMVGQETDGSVTPIDLGLLPMLADKPGSAHRDFLGRRSLARSALTRPDRKQLVGLLTEDPNAVIAEGAQLVAEPGKPPLPMIGHVTSSYFAARVGHSIALALVENGRARHGETVFAAPLVAAPPSLARRSPSFIRATIVPPVSYDPQGRRRDG
jgi:sarcosine oxidase subunit alpha